LPDFYSFCNNNNNNNKIDYSVRNDEVTHRTGTTGDSGKE